MESTGCTICVGANNRVNNCSIPIVTVDRYLEVSYYCSVINAKQ